MLLFVMSRSSQTHSSDIGNLLLGQSVEQTPLDMTQSIKNTPGLITSISSEDIERYQFTEFVDVLRYIPGFKVRKNDAESYRVSYHDGSLYRIQILINGRPQHGGGRPVNPWQQIPIPLDQIERVNVYRSPAAAQFGGNSLNAVVDIITKSSINTNSSLTTDVNSEGTFSANGSLVLSSGKHESTTYAMYRSDAGYDERQNFVSENETINNSLWTDTPRRAETTNIRTSYRYKGSNSLADVSLQYSSTERENSIIGPPPASPADIKIDRIVLSALLEKSVGKHSHKLQFDVTRWENEEIFLASTPRWLLWEETFQLREQNPGYLASLMRNQIPVGGDPSDDVIRDILLLRFRNSDFLNQVSGEINNNYEDISSRISYTDTFNMRDYLSIQFGLVYEDLQTDSDTFFNGKVNSYSIGQHLYTEINLDPVVFNIGYYVEKTSSLVSEEDTHFSPLVGVNVHFTSSDTLKLLYAGSNRSPDMVYTELDWRYTARNLTTLVSSSFGETPSDEARFFIRNTSEGIEFTSEKNESIQVVYIHENEKFSIETGLYYEERKDLLSSFFDYFNYVADQTSEITSKGVETTIQAKLTDKQTIRVIANYNDFQTNSTAERAFIPRYSGSIQHSISIGNVDLASSVGYVEYSFYDDIFARLSARRNFGKITTGISLEFNDNNEYDLNGADFQNDVTFFDVSRVNDEWNGRLYLRYDF